MQRVEPRELVAAAAAAIAPAVAWAAGLRPPVHADPTLHRWWALAAYDERIVWVCVAFAVWASGYGGWRLARTLDAGPVASALTAAATQLGPWTVLAAADGDLAGLGLGAALLGVAHPALGLVLGAWSPAVAVTIAAAAVLRRRWVGVGALVVGGALAMGVPPERAPVREPTPTTPTYAAEGGAWFPLPPAEARTWRLAAASYGGRWVHPLSPAVSGNRSAAMPTQALPLAVAGAVVPAAPTPWAPDPRRWRGMGGVALAVPLLALAGAAALRWRPLGGLLLVAAAAGTVWTVRERTRGGGPERLRAADLTAAPAADVAFPCPGAPWFGGRWSPADLSAVGIGAPPEAADPLLTALARRTGYGIDSRAAERATAHPDVELGAALAAVPGGVLVDTGALPGWGWANARAALEAAGARIEGEGTLVWVGPPTR